MDGWTNRQNERKCKLIIFRFLSLSLSLSRLDLFFVLLFLSSSQLSQICSIEEISIRVNVIIFFPILSSYLHERKEISRKSSSSSDLRINTQKEISKRERGTYTKKKNDEEIYFYMKYETLLTDSILFLIDIEVHMTRLLSRRI